MKPESCEQRARRLDPFHRRGLRWLVVGALALLAAGVVLIIWDGSGLTHRCIRIVDAWDLTGDCPKPQDGRRSSSWSPAGTRALDAENGSPAGRGFASTTQTARTNDGGKAHDTAISIRRAQRLRHHREVTPAQGSELQPLAMSATLMAAIIHLEDYARLVPRQLGLPLGARPQFVPKSPGHRKVGSTATIPEGADDDGTTPVPEA